MLYNPPTGGAANDSYVGKNVAAGIQGSKVPPKAIECPQREIVAVINGAIAEGLGIVASNADLTQLLQSIKFLIPRYAPAGAGIIAYGGLRKDASNNFGLDLANLNGGLGFAAPDIFAFRRASDGALLAGTLAQLAAYAQSTIIANGVFQQVVANQTLYVRPDGNDANNGLANASAGAFATVQGAINAGLAGYSFASGTLKIKLGAPGTYAAPTTIPRASGVITIEGDVGNQGAYVLAGSAGSNALVTAIGICVLNGLTINNTSTGLHTFAVGAGANAALNNVSLANPNGTSGATAFCVGGLLQFNAGCILSGNAQAGCNADSGGSISVNSNTVLQIAGNPTYSAGTVVATTQSRFVLQGGASFSGSANGPRYFAADYSKINVNGAGPNAIPGSSAGSTSNASYA